MHASLQCGARFRPLTFVVGGQLVEIVVRKLRGSERAVNRDSSQQALASSVPPSAPPDAKLSKMSHGACMGVSASAIALACDARLASCPCVASSVPFRSSSEAALSEMTCGACLGLRTVGSTKPRATKEVSRSTSQGQRTPKPPRAVKTLLSIASPCNVALKSLPRFARSVPSSISHRKPTCRN